MALKAQDLTYLGDGVYASFDGANVWLHTDRRSCGVDWLFANNVAINWDNLREVQRYVAEKLYPPTKKATDDGQSSLDL